MAKDGKTVVLVADDEPSTLAMVASHLRAKGYKVLEASDGDQAWELAHEHLPDLVVLDVMMPGMSGWEVCRKIREAVSLAHTGVVMLTGIGENLNEMTSPLYGADGYIDKPFEFSMLDKRIQETLGRRRSGAVGRLDGNEVEVSAEEATTVDDGWADPGTMPGVGPGEARPKGKKSKPPGDEALGGARAASKSPKQAGPKPQPRGKPAKKRTAKAMAASVKATPKKAKAAAKKARSTAKKSVKATRKAVETRAKKAAKTRAKKAPKTSSGKAKPAAAAQAKSATKRKTPAKRAAPRKAGKPASAASAKLLGAPVVKSAARKVKRRSKHK